MTRTPQLSFTDIWISFEKHQTNYTNVKKQETRKTFCMEKLNVTYLRKARGRELNSSDYPET